VSEAKDRDINRLVCREIVRFARDDMVRHVACACGSCLTHLTPFLFGG